MLEVKQNLLQTISDDSSLAALVVYLPRKHTIFCRESHLTPRVSVKPRTGRTITKFEFLPWLSEGAPGPQLHQVGLYQLPGKGM